MKILLIEDEPKMARTLKVGLEEQEISVDYALNGEQCCELAFTNDYSVIVSDIILPGLTGIDLLRRLRSDGRQTPVLLMSALSQMDDKAIGFEAGADDYLTKPFEFRELVMRIRALARRPVEQRPVTASTLQFADIIMDLETREITRNGKRIILTPREYALMEYFLRNPGRVISKTEITEQVWNLHFDTGTNVIEVYVNFLRKKIDKGFSSRLIHTQFKTGYILREEVD